jgi:hypothetical protein
VTAHDFNRAILKEVAHRPWPTPEGPWIMTQTWHDLLFAHWLIDVGQIRDQVPSAFILICSMELPGSLRSISHVERIAAKRAVAAVDIGISRAERTHVRSREREARDLLFQPRRRKQAGGASGEIAVQPAVLLGGHERRAERQQHRI